MFIVILWMIVSIIFIRQPMFSLQEMNATPLFLLQTIPPAFWGVVRITGVAVMGFVMVILTRNFFPKDKIKSLIYFSVMPWVFIIAHEFNPLILIFVLLLSLYLSFPKYRKYLLSLLIVFLLFVTFKYNPFTIKHIVDKLRILPQFFNLTNLFIQMEPISSYLHIPRNGYFSYVFLVPFIASFFVTTKKDLKNVKEFTLPIIFSLFFFILYPSNHLIFAGVGFLLLLSLYIVYAFNKITRNKLVALGCIVISIGLLGYFIEAYVRQYPMKFSVERSEAKINLMNYIITNPDKKIILPNDDDLRKLMKYYGKHADFSHVSFIENERTFMKKITVCKEESTACVLDDVGIERYKVDKEMSGIEHITLRNALSVYYVY